MMMFSQVYNEQKSWKQTLISGLWLSKNLLFICKAGISEKTII